MNSSTAINYIGEKSKNRVFLKEVIMPCVLVALLLTLGYFINNRIIVIAALGILGLSFLFNRLQNSFYILLFFIPYNNILKLSPDSISFLSIFSIELFLICFFQILKSNNRLYSPLVFKLVLLILLSLITFNLNTDYLVEFIGNFIILLNLVFLSSLSNKIDYEKSIISYVLGFLFTSVSGLLIGKLPQMSEFIYINMVSRDLGNITRFTGVDKDPNYYGFYALFAITLLLALKRSSKNYNISIINILILIISILGFLSFSKMFLLILVMIILLIIINNFNKIYRNIKYILYSAFGAILAWFFFSEKIYSYLISPYLERLIYNIDGGELSNGRIEILSEYIEILNSKIYIIFFGSGFFRDAQELSLATHNTYLTLIYTFGIFGTIVLLSFVKDVANQLKQNVFSKNIGEESIKKDFNITIYLPILSILLSMFFLDLLYMRFYFYILFLSLVIINEHKFSRNLFKSKG